MIYKQITFKVEVPVDVDWGDGNIISYPVGIVSGIPTGEVEITSQYPVEEIKFLTDTIAQANFVDAPDFKYANELFKDKDNVQVVYFDNKSPIVTTRQAFANSGIIYHADLSYHTPQQMQYTHLNAKRLQCVEGLDTTNAFNAYGLFQNTPKLQHPRKFEIEALEDTDKYGAKYMNTFQCTYPIFHLTLNASMDNMVDIFVPEYKAPKDYEFYYPLKDDFNTVGPKKWDNSVIGNTHLVDGGGATSFDGIGDYILVYMAGDNDKGSGSAWIQRHLSGRNYDTIFTDYLGANNGILWIPTDNHLYFQIGTETTTGRVMSADPVPIGEWVHVAVTYDMSDVKLFINGELVGHNQDGLGSGYNSSPRIWFTIGGGPYATDAYMYFKNVRWYNRKLRDEEIVAIYNEEA